MRRWIEGMSHASLFRRAVLYELIALVLIFLVTIAWYGHRRDPWAFTALLSVILMGYYYVFHWIAGDAC